MNPMIVTIDGPAGSGKSTAAKKLAKQLCEVTQLPFEFLDTGAMYRAIALYCQRRGITWQDEAAIAAILPEIQLTSRDGVIHLGEESVEGSIRNMEMADGASVVGKYHAVRELLANQQRQIAENKNIVTEGRDQGTKVFPDAPCKFFLRADVKVRAERRLKDVLLKDELATLERVIGEQVLRDKRDEERLEDPLRPATDAIIIDTSNLDKDELVACMAAIVSVREKKRVEACPPG
jgi:CMP/dCMP kinase